MKIQNIVFALAILATCGMSLQATHLKNYIGKNYVRENIENRMDAVDVVKNTVASEVYTANTVLPLSTTVDLIPEEFKYCSGIRCYDTRLFALDYWYYRLFLSMPYLRGLNCDMYSTSIRAYNACLYAPAGNYPYNDLLSW